MIIDMNSYLINCKIVESLVDHYHSLPTLLSMESKILRGPDYHIKFPKESLGKLFYDALLNHKGKDAFIDEFTNESLTYDQILDITCQLASAFENIQLKEGDLIAIYSENGIYYFLPLIAALYQGITTVLISHYYLENELTHALNLTKPSTIFCSRKYYTHFLKIRDRFGFIKRMIVMDFEEGVENFGTFISKNGNKDCMDLKLKDLDVQKNTALILFSSGTTGLPKGVMITQKNFISRLIHAKDPRLSYLEPKEIAIAIVPFCHVSGMITYTSCLILGVCTRVFWKFDERKFLKAIQDYRLTKLPLVPTLIVLLAKSPIVDEYDLSTMEDIITGGATLSEEVETRIIERFNVKYIRQLYGLTESCMIATCVPANTYKKGSSGKLVPGMMAAIRDPESGEFLGPRKIGEVVLKGDLIMAGYYNNPEATKNVFLENGFMKTGDLGYYDEEEHFFIVARLKELIKYKSFQVAPAELEALLMKHPKIFDAGVVGLPDEKAGELPMAFVVKQSHGKDLTAEEIIKYVSDNVSHQKRVRGGVRFVDVIPRNAMGKILRKDLKKMINRAKL